MKINELIEMLEAFEDICDGNVYVDGKEITNVTINFRNEIRKETSLNISTI